MIHLSDHGLRNALSFVLSDPIIGLYTDNASAPLGAHAGLRRFYKFGLFSYCAYVDKTAGLCVKANNFQPYKAITSDMLSNYSDHTDAIIGNTTFAKSLLLGYLSDEAYEGFMQGTPVAVMAFVASVRPHSSIFGFGSLAFIPPSGILEHIFRWDWTFFPIFLAASAGLGTLVGSARWTALIRTAGRINSLTITTKNVSLGIRVYAGTGLYCTWAAFVLLWASIIPYIIESAPFFGPILTIPEL